MEDDTQAQKTIGQSKGNVFGAFVTMFMGFHPGVQNHGEIMKPSGECTCLNALKASNEGDVQELAYANIDKGSGLHAHTMRPTLEWHTEQHTIAWRHISRHPSVVEC